MNTKLLLELLSTDSPSGDEVAIQRKIIDYVNDFKDEVITDNMKNVCTVVNKDADFKIMLTGHIDEIGYSVVNITDDGFLKLKGNGGVRNNLANAKRVNVHTKDGIIKGVVYSFSKDPKEVDLFVDCGFKTKEQAFIKVNIGDYVSYTYEYDFLENDLFTARALDNRLGAFIITEATKLAKEKGAIVGIYSTTTAGEETTGRGAFSMAQKINPDLNISVDVTWSSDYPGTSADKTGDIKLGCGAVLTVGSIICDKALLKLQSVAKTNGYSLQYEVANERSYTDADNVLKSNNGLNSLIISIPLRYMHSPSEVCNLKDVENIIGLLSDYLVEIGDGIDLDPFK